MDRSDGPFPARLYQLLGGVAGVTVAVTVPLPDTVCPPGKLVDDVHAACPGATTVALTVPLLDTDSPFGSVLVAFQLACPGAVAVASTVRSTAFPEGAVTVCCICQLPGATLVSVDAKLSCFPFARVIVPPELNSPGALRVVVPCQLDVAPFGRVAVPLKVPDCVALFHLPWDCHVPWPPAAFVHEPFVRAAPFATVVVDELVAVALPAAIAVLRLMTAPASSARIVLGRTTAETAIVEIAAKYPGQSWNFMGMRMSALRRFPAWDALRAPDDVTNRFVTNAYFYRISYAFLIHQ